MPIQNAKESNPVFEYLLKKIDQDVSYQDIMKATETSYIKLCFYLYLVMYCQSSHVLNFVNINTVKLSENKPLYKTTTFKNKVAFPRDETLW